MVETLAVLAPILAPAIMRVLDELFPDQDGNLKAVAASRLTAIALLLVQKEGLEKLRSEPLVKTEPLDLDSSLK